MALHLGNTPASVTGMLQKLASLKPPLINYHKHQGAKLTTKGRRAALEVIRHHRLLESWLVQTLGYSWTEVHNEAERLEHVISEEFEARIAAAMGNPTRDPHGDLIPGPELRMPQDDTIPLLALCPGQAAIVQRVKTNDINVLRFLEGLNLIPEKQVEVVNNSQIDNSLTIKAGNQVVILGSNITTTIYAEKK